MRPLRKATTLSDAQGNESGPRGSTSQLRSRLAPEVAVSLELTESALHIDRPSRRLASRRYHPTAITAQFLSQNGNAQRLATNGLSTEGLAGVADAFRPGW